MARKKNNRLKIEMFLSVIIIAIVFSVRYLIGGFMYISEPVAEESVQPTQQVQEKAKYNNEQMTGAINNIVAEYKAGENTKISVIYRNLKTDYRYAINDKEYFPMASTTKVLYAMDVYDRIHSGELKEDQDIPYKAAYAAEGNGRISNEQKQASYKLDYILMNMLTYSDNTATNMVVGSDANTMRILNRVLSKFGIELQPEMLVENKLTPEVMEKGLLEIYNNQDKYSKITEYTRNSIHSEWIKEGISNKTVASKYGQIPGVSNDIATVYGGKGDYLLLVYTENVADAPVAIKNIAAQIDKLHEEHN